MGNVWCADVVQGKGLTLLTTGTLGNKLKLVLLNTLPANRALATSTANCCGISTAVDVVAQAAYGTVGQAIWIKKTTDISGRYCTTKWIKNVGLIAASTLYFVTKCSTRNYSTAGPDKINASSWAIIFYDPTTAT